MNLPNGKNVRIELIKVYDTYENQTITYIDGKDFFSKVNSINGDKTEVISTEAVSGVQYPSVKKTKMLDIKADITPIGTGNTNAYAGSNASYDSSSYLVSVTGQGLPENTDMAKYVLVDGIKKSSITVVGTVDANGVLTLDTSVYFPITETDNFKIYTLDITTEESILNLLNNDTGYKVVELITSIYNEDGTPFMIYTASHDLYAPIKMVTDGGVGIGDGIVKYTVEFHTTDYNKQVVA